jgi:hypothetical protein
MKKGHAEQRRQPMSVTEIVVQGTLNPDGTLQLDEKPTLPPGRVTVVIRQEKGTAPPPGEDWFQYLQRMRASREAAGYPFMNEEEMNAHIEWLREGDRIDDLLREGEKQDTMSEKS